MNKKGNYLALLTLGLFVIGLLVFVMNQKENYKYTKDSRLMDQISKENKKNNKLYESTLRLGTMQKPLYDGYPTGVQAPWLPIPPPKMPGDPDNCKPPCNYEPPQANILSNSPPGSSLDPTGPTGPTGTRGPTGPKSLTGPVPRKPDDPIDPIIFIPKTDISDDCTMNFNPQCPTEMGQCMKLYNPCLDVSECCDVFQPLIPPLLPYGMRN